MYWRESRSYSDTTANKDELFEIDVRRKGNRYEVKLPWKENTQPSFNGYQLSESRLRSLHHKLRKEPSLLAEYDAIIQEQMKSGIAEKVPDKYLTNQEMSQNYYLPHMAVIRKDRKTTKVRVIYDGSANASKQEKSLNDCLQTGPNRLPHVFNKRSIGGILQTLLQGKKWSVTRSPTTTLIAQGWKHRKQEILLTSGIP